MKIHEAIKIIENRPRRSMHEEFQADLLAVEALQEKQEREKGCFCCHNKRRLTEYLHKGYNNCPMCGRRFNDELEGKNNG